MLIQTITRFLMAGLSFGIASLALASSAFTVYFVPLKRQTYEPITVQTIELKAQEKWKLNSVSAQSLKRLLASGEAFPFDEKNIRMKIIFDKSKFFVDMNGVYVNADNIKSFKVVNGRKLDIAKLEEFRLALPFTSKEILSGEVSGNDK